MQNTSIAKKQTSALAAARRTYPGTIPVSPIRRAPNATLLLALLVPLLGSPQLEAQNIIVPNQYAETDAPTMNTTVGGDAGAIRDMLMFDASQFGTLSGPAYLTGFAYRPNAIDSGPGGPRVTAIKVFASTTKRSVANLSTTFGQNLGTNTTLIFEGNFTFSTANLPGPGDTRQFDLIVPVTTPFLYDPAEGNLLLDFQISESHGTAVRWDAVSGHPMVRDLYAIGSATANTGQFGTVPVTRFTFEPAPRATIRLSQVEVCWNSVANATYRVEWQSDATQGAWTPLVNCIRSEGSMTCIQDPIAQGAAHRLYRVIRTDCTP